MNRLLAALLLALLAGCYTPPQKPPMSAADQEELARPLTCSSKEQCMVYWQRAQVYVSDNAGYKMQTVTDSIIETYNPTGSGVSLAWTVTRLPDSSGGATIRATVSCANMFVCIPSKDEAIIAFKRFVKA